MKAFFLLLTVSIFLSLSVSVSWAVDSDGDGLSDNVELNADIVPLTGRVRRDGRQVPAVFDLNQTIGVKEKPHGRAWFIVMEALLSAPALLCTRPPLCTMHCQMPVDAL